MRLNAKLPTRITIFVLTVLLAVPDVFAAPPPHISCEAAGMSPNMDAAIAPLVADAIEHGRLPGCVVLVGRRAGIVFEKAYGNRSVEPEVVPMTTDTLFDMASLTKPVATATSAMILIERGKLRLQDKVAKFFPDFAAKGKEEVTVEQLLIHSAGLIPDTPEGDFHGGWDAAKSKIFDLEPLAKPGSQFKYSDVGFILLGKIIEQVSGMLESEFVKAEVFEKLGMHDSGYLPSDELKKRAAPTEKREDQWLVGVVHDPRAALMGGVAGHAGLFSTAEDLATYATMMLNQGRYGDVQILSTATVAEMTRPRDINGSQRGLGWDMRTSYSKNRGEFMSARAFGHGGFTGTAMWIDPQLDLYVIFLSNRLHPDGVGEVNDLAGRIGSIACGAINSPSRSETGAESPAPISGVRRSAVVRGSVPTAKPNVQLGIDVLSESGFKQLAGKRVGLITNHTGRDSNGVSTAVRLRDAKDVQLVALFSPEHGIAGKVDTPKIGDSKDEETGVPVYSLYGESRKPTSEQLAEIDAFVFDIQDVGCRFYTYPSTMFLAMEAAAEAHKQFFVLDRPNPLNGDVIEGPLLDAGSESFVGYHSVPVRHGMTIGELAVMFATEKHLGLDLVVVPMTGWRRSKYLHDTGMTWVNPSPNMRSEMAALLYPGIGLLETTNVSVGRGTDAPFELMGAPWIHERDLAEMVNQANPPGVRVIPRRFTPTSSKYKDESCGGLNFVVTDWDQFRSFELGLVVAHALRELYPDDWNAKSYIRLLGNEEVARRVMDGDDVHAILDTVAGQVREFRERRKPFELYQ